MKPTARQWYRYVAEELCYGSLAVVVFAWGTLVSLPAVALVTTYWVVLYALWPVLAVVIGLRVVVSASVRCAVTITRLACRAIVATVRRRCDSRYDAHLGRVRSFRRWLTLRPMARQEVRLAVGRFAYSLVDVTPQVLSLLRAEKWARDPITQKGLLAICAAHPDLSKAARKVLPDTQGSGALGAGTVTVMRQLWRQAWEYDERQIVEALVSAKLAAAGTPEERLKSQKARDLAHFKASRLWGLWGAAGLTWLFVFWSSPVWVFWLTAVGTALFAFASVHRRLLLSKAEMVEPQPPILKGNTH